MKLDELLHKEQSHALNEDVLDHLKAFFTMTKLSRIIADEIEKTLQQSHMQSASVDEYRNTLRSKLEELRSLYKKMYKTRKEHSAIDRIIDDFIFELRQTDPLFR